MHNSYSSHLSFPLHSTRHFINRTETRKFADTFSLLFFFFFFSSWLVLFVFCYSFLGKVSSWLFGCHRTISWLGLMCNKLNYNDFGISTLPNKVHTLSSANHQLFSVASSSPLFGCCAVSHAMALRLIKIANDVLKMFFLFKLNVG